jgi:hypothetical protein
MLRLHLELLCNQLKELPPRWLGKKTRAIMRHPKAMVAEFEALSAASLQRDMMAHKSEFINSREHSTLNNVTKLAINYFENHYDFDAYLDDRSKKDKNL